MQKQNSSTCQLVCGATALAFATFVVSSASALEANKKTVINTYGSWDGSQFVYQFGCPDSTTYGQVVTIPSGAKNLDKFTFSWATVPGSSGSMVVRGEVYTWDGSKAVKAVWESDPRTISYGDSDYHKETFKPPAAKVKPGSQYVLFASIDKDYEECTNGYILQWAAVADTAYADGTFVYQNNAGNEGGWTTAPWNPFGIDLAFKASLSK